MRVNQNSKNDLQNYLGLRLDQSQQITTKITDLPRPSLNFEERNILSQNRATMTERMRLSRWNNENLSQLRSSNLDYSQTHRNLSSSRETSNQLSQRQQNHQVQQ